MEWPLEALNKGLAQNCVLSHNSGRTFLNGLKQGEIVDMRMNLNVFEIIQIIGLKKKV